jgi:ABC-2 type transport system ATP-binding protein
MEEADKLCSRVAIMHLGKLAVIGVPADLKASLNKENVTLDDVFVYYTGGELESGGSYREASMTRQTARRLG